MADHRPRQAVGGGQAGDGAEQLDPDVAAADQQGFQGRQHQFQVRPVRGRTHVADHHRRARGPGLARPGLAARPVLQPADAAVAGEGRQSSRQGFGGGDDEVRAAKRPAQGLDPARMAPGAVALDPHHHGQVEEVVVDVQDHRKALGLRRGEGALGAGHMAEARQHHGGGRGAVDLGLGQGARHGDAGQALVATEGGFFHDAHRRAALGPRGGEALDEGDGLGGAELVGEHQEADGRGRGEQVAVGRGLAFGIGCRHGTWTPFRPALSTESRGRDGPGGPSRIAAGSGRL